MTIVWIDLSTRWDKDSVQAALSVIISVLSTVGIWAFSRYWWQRETTSVLRGKSNVPLSALFTLSNLGEGWDAVAMLRERLLGKENWGLLLQLVVVITVTLASMLSGPIAKVSLRSTLTRQTSELEVLQVTKGDGPTANLLTANLSWNQTIDSLNVAGFPHNLLLDYLPPANASWVYVEREWDPTWTMTCNYTNETVLHRVKASGNATMMDPINAFPAFGHTFHKSLLNPSYRIQSDYVGWAIPALSKPFMDHLFVVLIQSDPEKPNPDTHHRMYTNNETIQISISVLHAKGFTVSNFLDAGDSGKETWKPIGRVGNASFARVECNITRKSNVRDNNAIPWIWTNDTYSITKAFTDFWLYGLEEVDTRNGTVATPTPEELLRFYQAYMVSVNTEYSQPSLRKVSVLKDTVQVSLVFLTIVVILAFLSLLQTGRYFCFLERHKQRLEPVYVPDGKIEWMIHAAKTAAHTEAEEANEEKKASDRHYFREATFGFGGPKAEDQNTVVQRPGLARVSHARTISRTSHSKTQGNRPRGVLQQHCPTLAVSGTNQTGSELKQDLSPVKYQVEHELVISPAKKKTSDLVSREYNVDFDGKTLTSQVSRPTLAGARPSFTEVLYPRKVSFQSSVMGTEEVPPVQGTARTFDENK